MDMLSLMNLPRGRKVITTLAAYWFPHWGLFGLLPNEMTCHQLQSKVTLKVTVTYWNKRPNLAKNLRVRRHGNPLLYSLFRLLLELRLLEDAYPILPNHTFSCLHKYTPSVISRDIGQSSRDIGQSTRSGRELTANCNGDHSCRLGMNLSSVS